ncbi:MAG: hypothetical protein ACK5O7_00640 [Holosporales bacterium]
MLSPLKKSRRVRLALASLGLALSWSFVSWASEIQTEIPDEIRALPGARLMAQGQYQVALAVLTPLAERNDLGAQRGCGICYQQLGDHPRSYEWYRRAAERGCLISAEKIADLGLWDHVLPQRVLTAVLQYLSMEDISNSKNVCATWHKTALDVIAETDFLHSTAAFAGEWRQEVLRDFEFHPEPEALRFGHYLQFTGPIIEIHFRDTHHLRSLVGKCKVSFNDHSIRYVRNPEVKDGEEFVPYDEDIYRCPALFVDSPEPMEIKGTLGRSYRVALQKLVGMEGGTHIHAFTLSDLSPALSLADALDDLEKTNYNANIIYASRLLAKAGFENREKLFEGIQAIGSSLIIFHYGKLMIDATHVLRSTKRLIYLGRDYRDIMFLKDDLPSLNYTCCIDPCLTKPGLLIEGDLKATPCIRIRCTDDMALMGDISLPDFSAVIKSKTHMWSCFGAEFYDIILAAKKNFLGPLKEEAHLNLQPAFMRDEMWHDLQQTYLTGTGNYHNYDDLEYASSESFSESDYDSDLASDSDLPADDYWNEDSDSRDGYRHKIRLQLVEPAKK